MIRKDLNKVRRVAGREEEGSTRFAESGSTSGIPGGLVSGLLPVMF